MWVVDLLILCDMSYRQGKGRSKWREQCLERFLLRQQGFGNTAKTSNYIFQIVEHVRPVRPKILASLTGSAGFHPELCHQLRDKNSRVLNKPCIRNERHMSTRSNFQRLRWKFCCKSPAEHPCKLWSWEQAPCPLSQSTLKASTMVNLRYFSPSAQVVFIMLNDHWWDFPPVIL